jgi:hypothetical protein
MTQAQYREQLLNAGFRKGRSSEVVANSEETLKAVRDARSHRVRPRVRGRTMLGLKVVATVP